jgi:hypothetical protein
MIVKTSWELRQTHISIWRVVVLGIFFALEIPHMITW